MARRDGKLPDLCRRPRQRRTMSATPRPAPLSYAVAVVSGFVATLVRLAFCDLLPEPAPYATSVLVAFFTGWYGVLRPALLCLALSAVAATVFIRPLGTPNSENADEWVALLVFFLLCGVAI